MCSIRAEMARDDPICQMPIRSDAFGGSHSQNAAVRLHESWSHNLAFAIIEDEPGGAWFWSLSIVDRGPPLEVEEGSVYTFHLMTCNLTRQLF